MALPTKHKIITFRPDSEIYAAMDAMRQSPGVSFAVQIRMALRMFHRIKPVKKAKP